MGIKKKETIENAVICQSSKGHKHREEQNSKASF